MSFWHLSLAMIRNKKFRGGRKLSRKNIPEKTSFCTGMEISNTLDLGVTYPASVSFSLDQRLAHLTAVTSLAEDTVCCDDHSAFTSHIDESTSV